MTEEFRYLSISEKIQTGESWTETFCTLEEANSHALSDWNHLTNSEKKRFHDFVVKVYRSYLNEDAEDDDGVVDWNCCHSWTTEDSEGIYFDSDKINAEAE